MILDSILTSQEMKVICEKHEVEYLRKYCKHYPQYTISAYADLPDGKVVVSLYTVNVITPPTAMDFTHLAWNGGIWTGSGWREPLNKKKKKI
jgi:hypothetical protein